MFCFQFMFYLFCFRFSCSIHFSGKLVTYQPPLSSEVWFLKLKSMQHLQLFAQHLLIPRPSPVHGY